MLIFFDNYKKFTLFMQEDNAEALRELVVGTKFGKAIRFICPVSHHLSMVIVGKRKKILLFFLEEGWFCIDETVKTLKNTYQLKSDKEEIW